MYVANARGDPLGTTLPRQSSRSMVWLLRIFPTIWRVLFVPRTRLYLRISSPSDIIGSWSHCWYWALVQEEWRWIHQRFWYFIEWAWDQGEAEWWKGFCHPGWEHHSRSWFPYALLLEIYDLVSRPIPCLPVDNKNFQIIDSTGALSPSKVPKQLTIVGGGVIGLELGTVYNRLGSQVWGGACDHVVGWDCGVCQQHWWSEWFWDG